MVDVTGGDLYSLWKIANVALPRVAAVYTSSSGSMGGAEGKIEGAFEDGTGRYGEPTYGGSMESFTKCFNEFHHILAQTGQNLMDTADSVNKAITEFREQDGSAGTELDCILEGGKVDGVQLHDPNDVNQNPPKPEDMPTKPDRPDNYDSPGDDKSKDPEAERREIREALEDIQEMEEK